MLPRHRKCLLQRATAGLDIDFQRQSLQERKFNGDILAAYAPASLAFKKDVGDFQMPEFRNIGPSFFKLTEQPVSGWARFILK